MAGEGDIKDDGKTQGITRRRTNDEGSIPTGEILDSRYRIGKYLGSGNHGEDYEIPTTQDVEDGEAPVY